MDNKLHSSICWLSVSIYNVSHKLSSPSSLVKKQGDRRYQVADGLMWVSGVKRPKGGAVRALTRHPQNPALRQRNAERKIIAFPEANQGSRSCVSAGRGLERADYSYRCQCRRKYSCKCQ